jgi:SAM-dependent methyltransferase
MENFGWWLQNTEGAIRSLLNQIRSEPRGPLLDVGCGRGTLLYLAREEGWEVSGIEINVELANFVNQELNIRCFQGSLFDVEVPLNHYRVLTLFDVLEHIYEPVKTLQRCREILRPGGIVVVKSPHWRMQYLKERVKEVIGIGTGDIGGICHINQFDPRSIQTAFRMANLNSVAVRPAKTLHPGMRGAPFNLRRTLDWGLRTAVNGLIGLLFRTMRFNVAFHLLAIARKSHLDR